MTFRWSLLLASSRIACGTVLLEGDRCWFAESCGTAGGGECVRNAWLTAARSALSDGAATAMTSGLVVDRSAAAKAITWTVS